MTKKIIFFKIDINDHKQIIKLFSDHKITDVIHLLLNLMDRSIESSFEFAQTNVLGTLSLLQASKKYGIQILKEFILPHIN